MIRKLGIGGGFAAVVIATGGLLWCDGSLAAEILLRGYLGLFSDGLDRLAQELRARGMRRCASTCIGQRLFPTFCGNAPRAK
jgi:hypothetical protein